MSVVGGEGVDMGVGVRVAVGMEVEAKVRVGVEVWQRRECDAGAGRRECGWW